MTQTRIIPVKAINVVRVAVDGSSKQGCGNSHRLYVGRHTDDNKAWDYRSYIAPNMSGAWDGVGQIKALYLGLNTDDGQGFFPEPADTDVPKVRVRRLIETFQDGDNADGTFNGSDYTFADSLSSTEVTKQMRADAGGLTKIDLTAYANAWAPATVKQSNGSKGLAKSHAGVVLLPAADLHKNDWSGWSDKADDDTYTPQFTLIYEPGITTPSAPTGLLPSDATQQVDAFEGDYDDPLRKDSVFSSVQVEVYPNSATQDGQSVNGNAIKSYSRTTNATERQENHFRVLRGNLVLNPAKNYKWRSRVQNEQGRWSAWSDLVQFSEINQNPDKPTLSPDGLTFTSLAGVWFRGGTFSDPDGDSLLAYQVQMSHLAIDDPLWDTPGVLFWDTGKTMVQIGSTSWQTQYGGQRLFAGDYTWRARQWDTREGVSDWAYGVLSLTEDFDTLPGNETTPQIAAQAPWRIVIYGMGDDRGPGDIVAVLNDAKSPGASIMYNAPGEIHFTLVKDHPQISVIEPRQTHYAVQFYTPDGWKDIFNGLITDIDASDTDVIFYGIDYLGLFAAVVDDRFDSSKPDLPYDKGGSKYVDVTLHTVLSDQLTRTIGVANSPVGFITVDTISVMDEHTSLWTTMQPCLQVVSGLIDSHKQGTGKNTRIKVWKDSTDDTWKVTLEDDAGQTRDNLRLRYGELVNGYRIVPFGTQWGSNINVVARDRTGLRVFYKSATAPAIDPTVWGRFDQVTVLDNISDENDLQRRVKQLAIHQSKLGKQIGIAIRNGLLMPRSGYDICDSLPVEVKDGAIDTTRFGSGYWVVNGIAWEGSDDGSSTVVLTLLPREDTTPPDTDLIPSAPISVQTEWQVGWVPPDVLGTVTSKYYVDQTTGIVYQRDESSGEAVYTAISEFTPEPPSEPTGLTLSTEVVTDTNGLPKTNVSITIDEAPDASTRTTYVLVTWDFV